MTNDKSLDVLGIKPVGDSLKIVTKGGIDGASAFLGRICLPAAEEFGLLLRDKVSAWRASNAIKIAQRAEQLLLERQELSVHAHPRLVHHAIESGSWQEDDRLQSMWAGLLASSCSDDGTDDSNLLFMSLLDQLTKVQGAILNHACETATKSVTQVGWISSSEVTLALPELQTLTGLLDTQRLDRELDHLRSLELIGGGMSGGFHPESLDADITPTALALHFFVRCQGYIGSPVEYWNLRYEMPQL